MLAECICMFKFIFIPALADFLAVGFSLKYISAQLATCINQAKMELHSR